MRQVSLVSFGITCCYCNIWESVEKIAQRLWEAGVDSRVVTLVLGSVLMWID